MKKKDFFLLPEPDCCR